MKSYLSLLEFLALCWMLAIPGQAQEYDLVIKGGRVIDPETDFDAVANVGITGGTIATITENAIAGKRVIDATGHLVAPGFIDFHAHGQNIPADRMQAFDGVTTALELESGILPVAAWYDNQRQAGRVLTLFFSFPLWPTRSSILVMKQVATMDSSIAGSGPAAS